MKAIRAAYKLFGLQITPIAKDYKSRLPTSRHCQSPWLITIHSAMVMRLCNCVVVAYIGITVEGYLAGDQLSSLISNNFGQYLPVIKMRLVAAS